MKLDVYSFSWNESAMLPYFMRYYEPIANSIVMYDNGSTDNSLEFLKTFPKVRIVKWEVKNQAAFQTSGIIRNNMWKESIGQADWVIVCDVDEILYHKDLLGFLEKQSHSSLIQSVGFQMMADSFPTTTGQIFEEVRQGFRIPKYDKTLLFNPNKITETNYIMGSHSMAPTGEVEIARDKLPLLHFKYLGIEYLLRRYAQLRSGIQARDPRGWGIHWKRSDETIINIFKQHRSQCIDVIEEIEKYND